MDMKMAGDEPFTLTIDSKLLRDLSTYLILMSSSTVEDFRPEVLNKVVSIQDNKEEMKATHSDARRITHWISHFDGRG